MAKVKVKKLPVASGNWMKDIEHLLSKKNVQEAMRLIAKNKV